MRQATQRIPLGTVVATRNALDAIPSSSILDALDRHENGDWGELSEQDRASNEEALILGERILSAYRTPSGARFWIITERDRSTTTVLLPEDY